MWENPPHLFGRQPGTMLVRLSQDRRRKKIRLNSKPWISCYYTPVPKGFDIGNKSKLWIRSVCYYLKCCTETRFSKMRSSGRKSSDESGG